MAPLEIVLDPKGPLPGLPGSRNNLYIAGDIVTGHVQVAARPDSIINLSLEFNGQLYAAVFNSSTCKTLEQTNNLFSFSSKPAINPDGKYPFSFQLPGTVVVAPDQSMAPRHVPITPQSLLPSFTFTNGGQKTWESGGTAKIEYKITANIEHKGAIFTKKHTATQMINISAAPLDGKTLMSSTPTEHVFTLTSPRLRPGMEHYQPTVIERMSSFLGNLHQDLGDPRLIVALRADLPNALALGSKIPCDLSINLLPESHNVDTPPKVFVLKVEAKLQVITEIAVQTIQKKKVNTMDLCLKKWDSNTMWIDYGYQHKMDISDWITEAFIHDVGNILAPSFTTANLKRRYQLDVEVWLECLGETWKKTFERDLTLLPAVSTSPAVVFEPSTGEKSALAMNSVQIEEAPPSYSES